MKEPGLGKQGLTVSMITRLKEQAPRYEYTSMRSAGQITMSVDEHAEMARLLQS